MVFGGPPPPVFTSFGAFGPPPISYAEPYYDVGGGGDGYEDDCEYHVPGVGFIGGGG